MLLCNVALCMAGLTEPAIFAVGGVEMAALLTVDVMNLLVRPLVYPATLPVNDNMKNGIGHPMRSLDIL